MAKRKIWSADVRVVATVYVIARNEREARKLIRAKLADGIEAGESEDISGAMYDSPDLPDISYSPAMTPDTRQRISVNFVAENDPEGEE